uniref:Probable arginine--tRNA ligase, mitochondrial n=1 Tax=Plectus sambesii TaxID=2011161 RepID=A0A914X250_9BILA
MRAVLDRLQTAHKKGSIIRELLRQKGHSKKKIVIDFSSPNIAKPFHVGNLRSTIIGRYVDYLLRSAGHEVTSINYLGDWGSQIGLMVRGFREFVDDSVWNDADPVKRLKLLRDTYVRSATLAQTDERYARESREVFARMEAQKSDEHWPIWQQASEISRQHLNNFYAMLNVRFDRWDCESAHVTAAKEMVDQLIERRIAERREDGLCVVHSVVNSVDTNASSSSSDLYALLRKADNSTLYLTRELAAIFDRRRRYDADEYLYVVENGQRLHFEQLKLVLRRMGEGELAEKVGHVNFGHVMGMSTRAGRVELVDDLLDAGVRLANDVILHSHSVKVAKEEDVKSVAFQLALSAIIANDLKRRRASDYEFSFERAFNFKDDSGPMIQMKHARLCGIERRNREEFGDFETSWVDYPLEESDVGKELMKRLSLFEPALEESLSQLQPCTVVVYAFQLARLSASALKPLRVIGQPKEIAVPRLFILSLTRKVLAECLIALGLTPLEEM